MSVNETTPADHRRVEFKEAITLFFNNYTNFQGRSSRGALWWWALASFILSVVTNFIETIIPGEVISTLVALAILIPNIAVGVRRLHDIGKTGWWVLIAFTVIGIVLLIYWYCQPGERAENRFGPDVEAGRAGSTPAQTTS